VKGRRKTRAVKTCDFRCGVAPCWLARARGEKEICRTRPRRSQGPGHAIPPSSHVSVAVPSRAPKARRSCLCVQGHAQLPVLRYPEQQQRCLLLRIRGAGRSLGRTCKPLSEGGWQAGRGPSCLLLAGTSMRLGGWRTRPLCHLSSSVITVMARASPEAATKARNGSKVAA
jgi:hypothetical protein